MQAAIESVDSRGSRRWTGTHGLRVFQNVSNLLAHDGLLPGIQQKCRNHRRVRLCRTALEDSLLRDAAATERYRIRDLPLPACPGLFFDSFVVPTLACSLLVARKIQTVLPRVCAHEPLSQNEPVSVRCHGSHAHRATKNVHEPPISLRISTGR